MKQILGSFVLLFSFALQASTSQINSDHCYSNGWTKEKWLALKENKFESPNPLTYQFLSQLKHCLADANPDIRDGVGFGAFSFWMRAEKVEKDTLSKLFNDLVEDISISRNDPENVYLPFAILVFSEVVRADRISPYLTDKQREKAVSVISKQLVNVTDHRGFIAPIGWRHMVAHSADVVLQLSLNTAITKDQLKSLLEGLSVVASTSEHGYIHGEPERIARAVIYAFVREEVLIEDSEHWLESVTSPKPFNGWGSIYQSEAGLIKRHNVRQFLLSLHFMLSNTKNEKLLKLKPVATRLLKST